MSDYKDFNFDEIEDILKRYSGDTSNSSNIPETSAESVDIKESDNNAVGESDNKAVAESDDKAVDDSRPKLSVKGVSNSSSVSDTKNKPRVSKSDMIKKSPNYDYQEKLRQERIRKNRMTNKILNILLVVFILIFVGSAGYLGYYFYKIRQAENDMNGVKALILPEDEESQSETGEETGEDGQPSGYIDINGVSVLKKYSEIYKSNNEFIGWLKIPDTNVDYPVMYTPEDEQFYLRKNFSKEYSTAGTLFVAAGSDPAAPSDNIIIYGHNMKAGTMFHSLLEYEDEAYYKAHQTIYFDTIFEKHEYEVIAAFRTVISNDEDSFKYYEFFDAQNEQEFNDFVKKAKELTTYNIPATAQYGDKLLTLSTCAYHANSGRYVVIAKMIQDEDDGGAEDK